MDTKHEKLLLQNKILLFKKFTPDSGMAEIMRTNISIQKRTKIRGIIKTIATNDKTKLKIHNMKCYCIESVQEY